MIHQSACYSTTWKPCGYSATEQSFEVVVGGTESQLFSGMSMNQCCMVQSNLWQETTSLWDTPRSTSTQHNIINSSTQGVKSTIAVRGEICFYFTTSVAEKTIQKPPFPSLLLTRSNLSPLSSAPVSFPSVHTVEGFPSDCVPLLSWDGCTTELTVLSYNTQLPAFPCEEVCRTNTIW